MTIAGAGDRRQPAQGPDFRKVAGNCILYAVYRWVNVVAPFEPRRQLRIVSAATQINDEIARDRDGARLIGELADDMQHQVNACRDSGARVTFAILNIKAIFQNLRSGGKQR